ncbi:hypothetical protein MOQ72_27215 [Saccharopolyspora sp. K220]|uniref:hypothetical protein n=1 Tax=Saccharopolyspora soli TaxID=2926618 RepID=UPI001F576D8E|nr:hypothetical protein [Saccharopolyspora soli]MCI2421139.1 hypothetical protein [Saccharopolyspora soli]
MSDQEFKEVPRDLYRQVEREAGDVHPALTGRYRSRRPREEFDPDWEYLLTAQASKKAVVAGLCCATLDVPEYIPPLILEVHCPKAWQLLVNAGVSYEQWNTGHCPAGFQSTVAAVANTELDGYAVQFGVGCDGPRDGRRDHRRSGRRAHVRVAADLGIARVQADPVAPPRSRRVRGRRAVPFQR